MSEITKRIRVYGIVQGVGFRPTVSRHATANGIRGNVCNKGPHLLPDKNNSGFTGKKMEGNARQLNQSNS